MPPIPPKDPSWPQFDLRVEDLAHPGLSIFLEAVQPLTALRNAVVASYKWLYTPDSAPTNVQSIVLVLRSMRGVAYTTGDHHNKEIHFSLDYIQSSANRARDEILGVLVHEVVHCYQYNAKGTCPGGLIEGVADYVRLHAGLAPPHWHRSGGDKWDAGYDTTGYFLDWIEERYHDGIVKELNAAMNDVEYDELIFKTATGLTVDELWELYCLHLKDKLPSRDGHLGLRADQTDEDIVYTSWSCTHLRQDTGRLRNTLKSYWRRIRVGIRHKSGLVRQVAPKSDAS